MTVVPHAAIGRSLLSIEDLGTDGIHRILDLTDHMAEVNRRPNPKVPALRGKTVCNVFFEDSTRTRLSFETAAKRLSADTMTFAVGPVERQQGREPARHDRDDRRDGRRRLRDPPQVERRAAGWSTVGRTPA